jgi:formate dehydrogenase assembly factor FdhD
MLHLESALELIERELKRLDEIEADFPDQKNIVAAERSLWVKTDRELRKTVSALEKQLQALYVGFLVNRENGLAARKPPPEPRGVIAKLKARFLK